MTRRLDIHDSDFEPAFVEMLGDKRESSADVNDTVSAILKDVREQGDAAVIEYTNRFDRTDMTVETMAFTDAELNAAESQCDPETVVALELAAERIRSFHDKQKPDDLDYTDEVGVRLGYRYTPMQSAGLYVPGGTASYPSSVLMNAIPAKVAGVERLVMVVPTPDGVVNPLVLTAARLAGVDEVYRIGGAQAVGALAFGTETIKPVDIIVGPGNAYVAAAKRQVFGIVGIDMVAGPSEILVVADGSNDPSWIAADLLSQAEHDAVAQSILITDDKAFADAVVDALESHLKTLPRAAIARKSWEDYGVIITVDDLMASGDIIDRIAAEHLELAVDDPDAMMGTFSNAGSVFMGRYTPEAVGDYVAGPNHVLPTARSARFSSGLGVGDFLKRSTFLQCDSESLAKIGPAAVTLAKAEGLDAHGLSVALRLNIPRE